MKILKSVLFTEQHEWVQGAGASVTVGITDFAQSELGDIVFIDLPPVGKSVKKGDVLAVVESTKAASDIYAPLSGTVTDVNTVLQDKPESINSDPYGAGWIAKLDQSDSGENSALLSPEKYAALTGGEIAG